MADIKDPRAPTRSELELIFRNPRTRRAFEQLFELVPSEFNASAQAVQDATVDAGTADAKATQAISGLVAATKRLKSNEVLTWLSMS